MSVSFYAILRALGIYPTPVYRLRPAPSAGPERSALWIKRDDLTHPDYGGNKVRKLEYILPEAARRGARRIVTVGAVGSHHVLATSLFGKRAGFEVEAVLVPQPRTEHATNNLRADLALGLHAFAAPAIWAAPAFVLGRLAAHADDAFYIPVGGSSALGALGYVDAGLELAEQVRAGVLPNPDVVVVTVGSGGTVAGLAVGFAMAGLDTRIVGICVATPVWMVRIMVDWLVRGTAARFAASLSKTSPGRLAEDARQLLTLDASFLGGGYGVATEAGARATEVASQLGVKLDPTYTAKAFAGALREVEQAREDRAGNVLYWHTLSSAPLAPLLAGASATADLPAPLAGLLR